MLRLGFRKTLTIGLFGWLTFPGCNTADKVLKDNKRNNLLDSAQVYYVKYGNTQLRPEEHLANLQKIEHLLDTFLDLRTSSKINESHLGIKRISPRDFTSRELKAFVYLADVYRLIPFYSHQNYSKIYKLYEEVGAKLNKNVNLIDALNDRLEYPHANQDFLKVHKDSLRKLLYAHILPGKYIKERKLLESVYDRDQRFRKILFGQTKKVDSLQAQVLLDSMDSADKLNYNIVHKILSNQGWLGINKIGKKASDGIFLVIQHLDDTAKFYKYHSSIVKAYKKRNITNIQYSTYIDRYSTYKYGYQIFGTQSYFDKVTRESIMLPLKDSINVNNMRSKIGLKPIELKKE